MCACPVPLKPPGGNPIYTASCLRFQGEDAKKALMHQLWQLANTCYASIHLPDLAHKHLLLRAKTDSKMNLGATTKIVENRHLRSTQKRRGRLLNHFL